MIQGNFIIASLISVIVWVICRICKCVKNKKVNIFREFILFVFFIYFLVLLKLTLFKWGIIELTNQFNGYMYRQYGIFGIINIVPFKETINIIADSNISLRNSLINVVGNILVFMPLGFFISMLFEKHNNLKKVLKIGFLSSLCIEICQLFVGSNVCDIDDVIYNTVGAVIGFICFRTFEKIIEKVNLKEKLNKIKDFHTENIFKKVAKGISIVGIIVVMSYIYAFYNQTASAEISDEQMGVKFFDCNKEDILLVKKFNNKKFYLINQDYGIQVSSVNKYILNRYVYTGEFADIENDKYGYIQEWINEDDSQNRMTPIVYGKNKNASKIIINVKDKTFEQNLKEDDYFMVIYPEMNSFNEKELNKIYSNEKNSIINVKFIDNMGKDINTINDLAQTSE